MAENGSAFTSLPLSGGGLAINELGQHQLIEIIEEQIEERLDKERLAGGRMHSLFNEFATTALLIFAVQHLDVLPYGTGFFTTIFWMIGVILSTYYGQSYMDTLILKCRQEQEQAQQQQQQQQQLPVPNIIGSSSARTLEVVDLYRLIKSVLMYVQKYFTYLAVGMFSTLIRIQSSDEPWTPTKVIYPLIVILLLTSAKTIAEQRLFRPIYVAKAATTTTGKQR